MKSHVHVFDHVAQRHITPEEGAAWMMGERYREMYERLYWLFTVVTLGNAILWFVFAVAKS